MQDFQAGLQGNRRGLTGMNRRDALATAVASSAMWAFGYSISKVSAEKGDDLPDSPADYFDENVKITLTKRHMIVSSDGIPTHKTGTFPNRTNPNSILRQNYEFKIPLEPRISRQTTKLPMGPIGVATNGIPFYNPYTAEGNDAVSGQFAEVFDSCCGHPDPMGRYHYHKYPVCVKSPFQDSGKTHSPLIGFAFDGFAIYGPRDDDGKFPADLDDCNGHTDDQRGYHYHVTTKFPYILGAYRGEVETANFDGRGGNREPGQGRPRQGHPPFRGGRPPGGPPPRRRPNGF